MKSDYCRYVSIRLYGKQSERIYIIKKGNAT